MMEVADYKKDDGAAIRMWGRNTGVGDWYRNQTWDFFTPNSPLSGVMIISVDSGKCLNVPLGRAPLDQEVLQLFTCSRTPDDRWGARNDTWRIETVLPGAGRDCR